jgi:hypothetical protein
VCNDKYFQRRHLQGRYSNAKRHDSMPQKQQQEKYSQMGWFTNWLRIYYDGWDYVSGLRPPTGLLFVPRVMILAADNSLLVHHSSLAVLPAEISRTSRRNRRRSENFAYQYLKYLKVFLHAVKSYDVGPSALFPIRRKVCWWFLSPLKIHRLGQVWTRDPCVQWQAH